MQRSNAVAPVRFGRRRAPLRESEFLTDESDTEAWRAACGAACGAAKDTLQIDAGSLDLLLVGTPTAISQSWSMIARQMSLVRVRVAVATLTLATQDDMLLRELSALAHFHFSSDYIHGQLSDEQAADLAAGALARGMDRTLFRCARLHRPTSTVLVGSAVAELPDMTLERAAELHLTSQLARRVQKPSRAAAATVQRLFEAATATAPLVSDLQRLLYVERRVFLARLATDFREAPLTELENIFHENPEEATAIVRAWLEVVELSLAGLVHRLLRDPAACRATRMAIVQATARLGNYREQLAREENRLGALRHAAARHVLAQDQLRLLARRSRSLWRGPARLWQTWRLKRRLREFLALRSTEESLHRGHKRPWREAQAPCRLPIPLG